MRRNHRSAYHYVPYGRQEKKKGGFLRGLLMFLLLLVLVVAAGNYIVDNQVRYDNLKVTVTSLPGDLENWSILHFSDLHGRELGKAQSQIKSALGTVRVSSIVFSGDMLGPKGDVTALLDLAALLPGDVPKLLLVGDEDDYYLDPTPHGHASALADWALAAQDAGITILDEPILFTRGRDGSARIWFVPEYLYSLDLDSLDRAYRSQLDSLTGSLTAEQAARRRVAEYQVERVARIREAKASIKSTDIQIAVTHVPLTKDYVDEMLQTNAKGTVFSLRNVGLVLAGHTCAGQWRLPGVGAVWSPDDGWFPSDDKLTGFGYISGVPQYISPGLSVSGIYPYFPFRFFNSPTVTYIALTNKIVLH